MFLTRRPKPKHDLDYRKPNEKPSPLLSTRKAAEFLGVSPAAIYEWQKQGKILPSLKTRHGRYYYAQCSLARFRHDSSVKSALHDIEAVAQRSSDAVPPDSAQTTKKAEGGVEAPPNLLTSGEAARLLNVDQKTLYRWRIERIFEPLVITPTGVARYSKEQVKSFSREDVRQMVSERRGARLSIGERVHRRLQQRICLGSGLPPFISEEQARERGLDPDKAPEVYMGAPKVTFGNRIMTKSLTTAQAARMLKLDSKTLRWWANEGFFEPCYITQSGEPRYTEAQVEAFSKTLTKRLAAQVRNCTSDPEMITRWRIALRRVRGQPIPPRWL